MILTYQGHSQFTLESAAGCRVVFDPFDKSVGYPMRKVRADFVIPSHKHGDHHDLSKVEGMTAVVETAGVTRLSPDVEAELLPAYHDDAQGAKRGETFLTSLKMDGLKIVHLGDLGCMLTDRQAAALQNPDILLIPVGGFYTIDATLAAFIAHRLAPRITIPMHYKTSVNADWPIATEEEFLALMHCPTPERLPILRVTKEDISCLPSVLLMERD